MGTRLHIYIEKIEQGISINYPAFLKLAKGFERYAGEASFTTEKIGKDSWKVVDYKTSFFEWLKSQSQSSNGSKNEAATQNRSHYVDASCSMLLLREGLDSPRPVMIDEASGSNFKPHNRQVLIIENKANFFYILQTATFLAQYCQVDLNKKWDVIYGSGNEITCKLHREVLSHYQNIAMHFDVDLAGLHIAKSLAALTPKAAHHFVLPYDIEHRLQHVEIGIDETAKEACFKVSREVAFLKNAAGVIYNTGKTLEQESFLHE